MIDQAVKLFKQASEVFVITGAGISADSGLPTYRGFGGLYDGNVTEDGMPIEEALSGSMFRTRPEITWKYLLQIEKSVRGATFNRAHTVLAEMEKTFDRFWLLTQNIDGFHNAAGSENLIEIHGNMHRLKCTHCDYLETFENYRNVFESVDPGTPPTCPNCSEMARPDVVLFGEQLPEQAMATWYEQSNRPFDLVVSIGTSSSFPYILEPIINASRMGIPTMEINPGETDLSSMVDVKVSLGAAEALDKIWKEVV
jgi:NAD-dependent deacetylase